MEITRVKVSELRPNQCRKHVDAEKQAGTTASIKKHKMQVPIICYRDENGLIILDGHMRWDAHKQLGLEEIDAVILPEKPCPAKLKILQLILDVHKAALNKFERADLLQSIMDELKCTVTELAVHVGMKQPLTSKLLPLASMSPELRKILEFADQEKCYYVAVAPPEKQLELAMQAAGLTRDQLHAHVRGLEPKSKSAVFALLGFTITLRGRAFVLKDCASVLQALIKEVKAAERDSIELPTLCRMLADKAGAKS